MKFSIAIYGGPNDSQAPLSALHFAKAVLSSGHTLYRVFFYNEAVVVANELMVAPQDELNLNQAWSEFSKNHDIDLVVCIASALRRGMLNESEANRYEKNNHNISPAFTVSGLGQLIDAGIQSDRLVSFGN
ncbi:MAG: sulfurtransferase complex subunit TusD [Pseudomonadales bacterium]|nr:sulfurtransferase complex subunit TusD [Pseudomonadales bacterium]